MKISCLNWIHKVVYSFYIVCHFQYKKPAYRTTFLNWILNNISTFFSLLAVQYCTCFYIKVFTFSCLATLSHIFIPLRFINSCHICQYFSISIDLRFSNFSSRFLNTIFFSNLNSHCYNVLDLRKLQEQVKKHSV